MTQAPDVPGGASASLRAAQARIDALEAEVRRRNAELAIVNEVGQALVRQLDFDSIMAAVGERAAQALGAPGLSIAMRDPDTDQVKFLYWLDDGVQKPELQGRVLDDILTARIIASGRPIRVGSADEAAAIGAPFKVERTESYLGVPIPSGDRITGVIAIGSTERDAYGPDDERLLSTLATTMGVALDNARLLTEQAEASAEIRRQKHYFETLVDISPVAVITMNRAQIVSGWNPAATRLLGYQPDEALGRHIDDLVFRPEDRDEGRATTQLAEETGRAQLIARRRRKDGELVDVEIFMVPLVVDAEHTGYYAIYHDITELQAARRAADAANEAKSTFLASMSHEIRNPMNAIIGMSGLLLRTEMDPDQRDFAETIRTSGEALLAIINDVLDFSKIEAGRIELEAIPFALGPCIEGAIDVVAPSAAAKQLELAYAIDPDLPHALVGDAGRLRQVVLNLVSNAVKFTDAGEIFVSASGRRLQAGSGDDTEAARWEISIAVRDTGIGIPPDRMDRLFQSFSQADASITRRFGGTGLGLAISSRLAELQGGSIMAESSGIPGEGSQFVLRIVAPEAPPDAVAAPAPRPLDELTGKSALIVDDSSTNRRILAAQLRQWGMRVRATGSGQEAIDWVRDGTRFDVAIIDSLIADLDGLALGTALGEVSGSRQLPIILISSVGQRARAAGNAAAWLTKPVKPSPLLDALHGVLADVTQLPATSEVPLAATVPLGERHPLRILVAEDNVANQKLMVRLLGLMGYSSEVAGNGLEAIAALESGTFDLVFMDVQMPELDGLEATRRIRNRWLGSAGPRIVAMTASVMVGARELCLAAGMDDYMSKPIRVEELLAALEATPVREPATGHARPETLDQNALAKLLAMVGHDPDFVDELVDHYLVEGPQQVAAANAALDAGDAAGLGRAAHALHGSSLNLGGTRVARIARVIEERGLAGKLDGVDTLLADLELARIELAQALEDARARRWAEA